jgi:hypothetical protein
MKAAMGSPTWVLARPLYEPPSPCPLGRVHGEEVSVLAWPHPLAAQLDHAGTSGANQGD